MIATLSGKLKLREPGRLIVETGGVGYEIFVPLSTYYRMPSVGAEIELELRQIVRQDAILLYGFATVAEKHTFDLLMGVQHVGSKLALAVLSVLSPRDLVAAITHEDEHLRVWFHPQVNAYRCFSSLLCAGVVNQAVAMQRWCRGLTKARTVQRHLQIAAAHLPRDIGRHCPAVTRER